MDRVALTAATQIFYLLDKNGFFFSVIKSLDNLSINVTISTDLLEISQSHQRFWAKSNRILKTWSGTQTEETFRKIDMKNVRRLYSSVPFIKCDFRFV